MILVIVMRYSIVLYVYYRSSLYSNVVHVNINMRLCTWILCF